MMPSLSFTPSVTDYNQQSQLHNQQMPTQVDIRPSAPSTTEKWTNQGPMLAVSSHSGNYLPSSAIPQHMLKTVDQVLQENYKVRAEASVGTLCQILAKEAFFGKELMEQSTLNGAWDSPGLPQQELNNLKATMFQLFPRFQNCPKQFEPLWKNVWLQ